MCFDLQKAEGFVADGNFLRIPPSCYIVSGTRVWNDTSVLDNDARDYVTLRWRTQHYVTTSRLNQSR